MNHGKFRIVKTSRGKVAYPYISLSALAFCSVAPWSAPVVVECTNKKPRVREKPHDAPKKLHDVL